MADPAPTDSKPKVERKEVEYTVIGAVGNKDIDIAELDWKIIGTAKATTPGGAKAKLLEANPEFPGEILSDKTAEATGSATRPKDLQSLVRGQRLWLHADSRWKPLLVEVEQPPPKFVGL
jgi:hypothetical protein